jgi:NAD(P)-dependent dehydrogenase (short-subunit alcohol dehydrogenase family)
VQIDACRLGGLNEVLAVLLMAAKYGLPVWPHAGGVGLCEYVQHLQMIDYIAVSGTMEGRVIEYVDHLHEHFLEPCVIRNAAYMPPAAGLFDRDEAGPIDHCRRPVRPVEPAEMSVRAGRHSAMNQIDLNGQVAVVTGGAQGLGFAIAQRLVKSGAKVSPVGHECRNSRRGEGLTWAMPPARSRSNITDYDAVAKATAAVEKAHGQDRHSRQLGRHCRQERPARRIRTRRVAPRHRHRPQRHLLRQPRRVPGMKARNYGRIVNIASIAGKEGNPNASAYAAAKGGVIAMTKALGKELAKYDIAVNAITPATAKTRILDELKPEFIDYMLSPHPARPLPRSRRSRQHGRLAGEQGKQLHHRIGVRPVGRPRHLLILDGLLVIDLDI